MYFLKNYADHDELLSNKNSYSEVISGINLKLNFLSKPTSFKQLK